MCCFSNKILNYITITCCLLYVLFNRWLICTKCNYYKSTDDWYNCDYKMTKNEIIDHVSCKKICTNIVEANIATDCQHLLQQNIQGECYDAYGRACKAICQHNFQNRIIYDLTLDDTAQSFTLINAIDNPDKVNKKLKNGHGIVRKNTNNNKPELITELITDKTVRSYYKEINHRSLSDTLPCVVMFNMIILLLVVIPIVSCIEGYYVNL